MVRPIRHAKALAKQKKTLDNLKAGVLFEQANPRLASKVIAWAESDPPCARCEDHVVSDAVRKAAEELRASIAKGDTAAALAQCDALTAAADTWDEETEKVAIPWKIRAHLIELSMRVGAERDKTRERLGLLIAKAPQTTNKTVNVFQFTQGLSDEQRRVLETVRLNQLHGRVENALPVAAEIVS